ncbi:hypothetical protein AMS68_007970 [Peltaster fructicola]|uniref:PPPDE domain-containing protein n=1 Tax=Peltaster fructicola TaxID=286661 RepID=A0A6H0Y625_9PEZI|nr:hypothetical protein AMS68_007970 [Peltaster fructicola]
MPSLKKSGHSRLQSSLSARSQSSLAAPKLEVIINVYDLLPPGKLSSVLWGLGAGLLHSGVVIRDREYAYGGHNQRGMTGVYWTQPKQEPPGGRYRCDILHGFAFRTDQELGNIIQEVSNQFLGTSYNLLTQNCNHFTSALCQALTSKPAPSWLNRAASIGVALPCMVPKEWVTPPDAETADGELLDAGDNDEVDDSDDDLDDERSGMMSSQRRHERRVAASEDSSGRPLPVAERAPVTE